MHICIQDEIWFGAMCAQEIIHPMIAQSYVQDNKPCGVDIVLFGEIMKHHNVDILECCLQCKDRHINKDYNN